MIKPRSIAALLFLLLFHQNLIAQKSLPRSTPEAEGVSSQNIVQFLDAAAKSKTEFHSFMLLRHGKVIAEGWWNPYRADLKHTLYSCSKSFTATAMGFAIQEKKVKLDDKVVSFFPNYLPDTVTAYLADLTVKDALMMSDGQEPDPTSKVISKDTNWVKGFFAIPVLHDPGTTFLYNSLGTYMLSAIIQKVTGQSTLDYLKPRLFDPLGIRGMDWETDLQGISTGGWGLRLKTEDMAKFAELFLQKGKWNGKQILPEGWVEEASTMKIMQDPNAPQSKKDSSDWLQGYCYQMWRCRHNAYRGDGAFGQFMIVMPDQDAALAITAETPDMQEEINLVWQYLLPAFKNGKLPANKAAYAQLKEKIKTLALTAPAKQGSPATAINGRNFTASANELKIQNIAFNFSNDVCHVDFKTDAATYPISFGAGKWNESETGMPMPSLTGAAIEKRDMLYPAKIAASYTWKDANTLELVLRYIESPHSETFTCHFDGNKLNIEVARSFSFGKNKIAIEAVQQ
ncbi:MAG TPA: serine hydrolase [Parafilimonas sp.]|nr:serine hydrolase [Parafilimonas sp.]